MTDSLSVLASYDLGGRIGRVRLATLWHVRVAPLFFCQSPAVTARTKKDFVFVDCRWAVVLLPAA
jgi:hypothetical protein